MQNIRLLTICVFFALLFFFPAAQSVEASVLDDVVNGIRNFFVPEPKKEFTIDSKIELAPGGDVEKNGEIDAGDLIRFTYTLTNKTDKEYSFATLKTNINRKQLNYIHNITGVTSLNSKGDTIMIPNYRIGARQYATISFDARLNYITDKAFMISTEADFTDRDKKSIVKSPKRETKVNKIEVDKIPGMKDQSVRKVGKQQ